MSTEYGVFFKDTLYDYPVQKEPIIEYILYKGDAICISSRPGTGKSLLLKHLMFNLTTGTPFLQLYSITKPSTVLYVQTEGDRSETLERIGNMKVGLSIDDSKWAHINLSGLILNTTNGINKLIELADKPKMKYDVIIIDPLYTTVKGSLNDSEVATDWIRNIRKMKDRYNAALIVSHHETKDIYYEGRIVSKSIDDLMGSAFWAAFFNHNFKLRIYNGLHYLEGGKQRSGRIIDRVVMKLVEPRPLMFIASDTDIDLGMIRIRSLLQEEGKLTAKSLSKKSELSIATVYRSLKTLANNGRVRRVEIDSIPYYELKRNKNETT